MKFLSPMKNLIKMVGIFIESGVLVSPNDEKMVRALEKLDHSIDKCKRIKI